MWILFAFGSAVFAGLTSILAKCGIRKTDSDAATAIRTIVVLIFSWIMMLITGSIGTISSLSSKTWMFLILSGIATGVSWLCYFKALQLVNQALWHRIHDACAGDTNLKAFLSFFSMSSSMTYSLETQLQKIRPMVMS